MRYFYIHSAGHAEGPVSDEALIELRRRGAIGDGTRVAREGESEWRTFGDFYRPGDAPAAGEAALVPISVRVFGICNIVFGTFGLLCLPLMGFALALAFLGGSGGGRTGPAYQGWLVFSMTLGLFLCVALLASGVGLCRAREWGRKLALAYAWVDILHTLASVTVDARVSPLLRMEEAKAAWGTALFTFLLAIGLAYPILLLVYMSCASVRDALAARE